MLGPGNEQSPTTQGYVLTARAAVEGNVWVISPVTIGRVEFDGSMVPCSMAGR